MVLDRYATKIETELIAKDLETLKDYTPKLAKTTEIMDKIRVLNRDIWEELEKKHDARNFERKFDGLRTSLED